MAAQLADCQEVLSSIESVSQSELWTMDKVQKPSDYEWKMPD
jgi:hypothetical protein